MRHCKLIPNTFSAYRELAFFVQMSRHTLSKYVLSFDDPILADRLLGNTDNSLPVCDLRVH